MQNCGNCKTCNQSQETAAIKEWLGLIDINPEMWHEAKNVHERWRLFCAKEF
jgi:hypothetical protein